MKKLTFIRPLLFTGISLLFLNSCSLLSAAGLNDKGLSNKEASEEIVSTTANSEINVDHSAWDKLLKKHVNSDGLVNYKGFQADRKALDSYISMLARNQPSDKWSVQEQLAYYINTYNANTVKLILENYPVKSIKEIKGAWTKDMVKIGNVQISLGGIENSILRKMNEPRIHFAINCASISCPKLMNEAYTAAKINEQLDKATTQFINSDKNDLSENSPKVSSIFDWYKKDFRDSDQTVIDYINKYAETKISDTATLNYKDYNWNLNEQK